MRSYQGKSMTMESNFPRLRGREISRGSPILKSELGHSRWKGPGSEHADAPARLSELSENWPWLQSLEFAQCPFVSLIVLKYLICQAYSSAQRSAVISCFQKWIKNTWTSWPCLPWEITISASLLQVHLVIPWTFLLFPLILTSVVCFISYSRPKPRPYPPRSLPDYWCTYY